MAHHGSNKTLFDIEANFSDKAGGGGNMLNFYRSTLISSNAQSSFRPKKLNHYADLTTAFVETPNGVPTMIDWMDDPDNELSKLGSNVNIVQRTYVSCCPSLYSNRSSTTHIYRLIKQTF